MYCWELEKDGQAIAFEPNAWITVNDSAALRSLATSGAGLACLLSDIAADDLANGSLIRVLADWCPPFPGYFLYHTSHRYVPAKVRALIDYLRNGRKVDC